MSIPKKKQRSLLTDDMFFCTSSIPLGNASFVVQRNFHSSLYTFFYINVAFIEIEQIIVNVKENMYKY